MINCKTTPTKAKEILEESLWLNKNITIAKKSIHCKTWEDKGITKIGNIMNKQGNFSNHIEISNKFNLICNFIQILQIRQSISLEWRNKINNENIKENNNTEQKLQIKLCGTLKPITKILCKNYWHIINKAKHEPTIKTKWSDIYNEFKEVDNDIWKKKKNALQHM